LWQELAADPNDGIFACEQLAIHYSRRAKDPARAAEFARLGLAKLRRQRILLRDPLAAVRLARLEQKFVHRLARLDHQIKIARRTPALLPGAQSFSPAAGSGRSI
jgi:hypothetical protein